MFTMTGARLHRRQKLGRAGGFRGRKSKLANELERRVIIEQK